MSCFKNFLSSCPTKRGNLLFLPSGDELQGKGPLFSGPGRQNVILTMGRSGCYWDDGIHQVHFPAAPSGGGGHHRSGGRLCGSPCRHALPKMDMETAIRSATLPPDFPPPSRGSQFPLSTVPPWNFIWGGSAEKEKLPRRIPDNSRNQHTVRIKGSKEFYNMSIPKDYFEQVYSGWLGRSSASGWARPLKLELRAHPEHLRGR